MSQKKDCFEVLGVSRDASVDEIKRKYRILAMKYHPDKNKGNAEFEKKFKEINNCYQILSNPEKRSSYEQFGEEGPQFQGGSSDFGDFDFGDIFSQFGFGGQTNSSRSRVGSDILLNLNITFDDSYLGVNKEVNYNVWKKCSECSGNGSYKGNNLANCNNCSGAGFINQRVQTPFGIQMIRTSCSKCSGAGKIIKRTCTGCKGKKSVVSRNKLEVTIPQGISSGQRVKISGKGNQEQFAISPGNLYIEINVSSNKNYFRRDDDLIIPVKMNIFEILLGKEVKIQTPIGEKFVTTPQLAKLNTKVLINGIPGFKHLANNSKGKTYIIFYPIYPSKLSKDNIKDLNNLNNNTVFTTKAEKSKSWFKNIFGK